MKKLKDSKLLQNKVRRAKFYNLYSLIFSPKDRFKQTTIERFINSRSYDLWQYYNLVKRIFISMIKFVFIVAKLLTILYKEGPRSFKSHLFSFAQERNFYHKFKAEYRYNIKLFYPDKRSISYQLKQSHLLRLQPLISIVMPVYNPNPRHFAEAIQSVIDQTYTQWELIVVDDASTNDDIKLLMTSYSKKDQRIRSYFRETNGHICKATNTGIDKSRGKFIGFLDHDDILWPNALFEVANAFNLNPNIDFFYSDEDKIDENGLHTDPFFKPDWSPYFLRSINYITHFVVLRSNIVKKVGKIDLKTQGAQDWGLFLKVSSFIENLGNDKPISSRKSIHHIPKILYSWRKSISSTASEVSVHFVKDYVPLNQERVLRYDLQRRGTSASVAPTKYRGIWQTKYILKDLPLVSIIIPTKDNFRYIKRCVESVTKKTTYANYEIILVDTGSETISVKDLYRSWKYQYPNLRVLKWEREFNFASVCNYGVKNAKGDYILLLNNDTEIIDRHWLRQLLPYAMQPNVGAVGPLLIFPTGEIQHAGIVLGIKGGIIDKGIAGHLFKRFHFETDYAIFNPYLKSVREVSGVTAACLLVKKSRYLEVGGQDEFFKIAFNDVDFNLKLLKKGYYNLYYPHVKVKHFESISIGQIGSNQRNIEQFKKEIEMMHKKWGELLQHDPFYNPNFCLDHEIPSLKLC